MSKWTEIRNCHSDENIVYVDGYLTDDQMEDGRVIAKIDTVSKSVTYIDEVAKTDSYAQEVIKNTLAKY